MLKKILITLVVVLIVVVGIAYYLLSNIDSIAKGIIEESGTNVLGTQVSVESVSIKLTEGRATILNLAVANPPGFSDHPAFRFDEVNAVMDIGSGVVKRLYSSQPEIRVEFVDEQSNFLVLQQNIKASTPQAETAEEQQPEPDEDKEKAPLSVQIDQILVEGARAVVISDEVAEPLEFTIDRLQFQNLKGSPHQIARVALGQFITQVLAATARNMIEKEAKQMLEEQGGKLKSKLEELLNQ